MMSSTTSDQYFYRVAVFLVLRDGEKILLHKRINTHHENGNYGLPAGHLDGNETVYEGIAREAKEEAGITIHPNDLTVVHVLHNKGEPPYGEYFNIFLTASKWTGEPKNTEPDRCGDLSWFPIDNLPSNTIQYIRQVLDCMDRGVTYSDFGWTKSSAVQNTRS